MIIISSEVWYISDGRRFKPMIECEEGRDWPLGVFVMPFMEWLR